MKAIRDAATGMGGGQVAALVLAHPDLLQRQHTLVRDAGAWLKGHMPAEQVAQLVAADPALLGSSEWALKETAAKLKLWTDVVGAPREAVLAEYSSCLGDVMLPDLAAAYVLAQASGG